MSDPQQHDQAESKKLDLLQEWIGKQIGEGMVARMATITTLQLVGAGLIPAGRAKQLVDDALAQGTLTPPAFFFAALLDLCQQLGGGIVKLPAFVLPIPTDVYQFTEAAFEEQLRRRLKPSIN